MTQLRFGKASDFLNVTQVAELTLEAESSDFITLWTQIYKKSFYNLVTQVRGKHKVVEGFHRIGVAYFFYAEKEAHNLNLIISDPEFQAWNFMASWKVNE